MNYGSLARRAAFFVVGHIVLLGAVMMFAVSISNVDINDLGDQTGSITSIEQR